MRALVGVLVGLVACGGEGESPVDPAPLGGGGGGGAAAGGEGGGGEAEAPRAARGVWARRFGRDTDAGGAVAALPGGGVVVAGRFFGEADFGGGPVRSVADNFDGFVAELGEGGELRAFLRFGDVGADGALDVCADEGGSVAFVGFSAGQVDLGGGPVGGLFLARLGEDGQHVFTRPLEELGGSVWGVRCACGEGGVWVAGTFSGTLVLDGFKLEAPGAPRAFVARVGKGGAVLAARALPEAPESAELDVTVETLGAAPGGGVLLGGSHRGRVDFGGGPLDPGPGESEGPLDQAFVVRLSADLAHVASASFGGRGGDRVTALSWAEDGRVLAGLTGLGPLGSGLGAGLDPGASGDSEPDLFWLRLGEELAVEGAGRLEVSPEPEGPGSYGARARVAGVADRPGGGVRLLAEFGGRVRIGEGEIRAGGERDAFFAELSAAGELRALRRLGGGGPDSALALLPGPGGDVRVALSAVGALDAGTGKLPSTGFYQAVVARLTP